MLIVARPKRFETRALVSSATVLGLVLASLSLGAAPVAAATATSNPADALHNFTVLTQGDAKLRVGGSGGEFEGTLAAGGDVSFGNYNLLVNKDGSALPSVDGPDVQLFVKGTVAIDAAANKLDLKGNAKVTNTTGMVVSADGRLGRPGVSGYVLNQSSTPQKSLAAYTATAGAFDAAFPASTFPTLIGYSEMYRDFTSSTPGVVIVPAGVNDGGKLRLTLTADTTNVLNITRSQLDSYSEINFASAKPNLMTPLIINVAPNSSGDTGSSFAPPRVTGGDQSYFAHYVMWNFPDFTKLTLSGSVEMGGLVLAPQADLIYDRNNPLRGQVVAKTLAVTGSAELHHYGFKSSLPNPKTVSATPTYADGTCAPSNRTNALTAPAIEHVEYTWTANAAQPSLVGSTFSSFSSSSLAAGTYSFTIAATDGYTLTGSPTFSHTYTAAPSDCVIAEATGSFSFRPPVCAPDGGAVYTLTAPTHASYVITVDGIEQAPTRTAGEFGMTTGVEYGITIVPDSGYALAAGVQGNEKATYRSLDCAVATGHVSFTAPTCAAPTASYTLDAASNAHYRVQRGTDAAVDGVTGIAQTMDLGVRYTITIEPNSGYTLTGSTTNSQSETFTAANCADAIGGVTYSSPTCSVQSASYTLSAPTHATYLVQRGTDAAVAGIVGEAQSMDLGVQYTVTIVPDRGFTLSSASRQTLSQKFDAVNCADATGSFSFIAPTCASPTAWYTLNTAPNATYQVQRGTDAPVTGTIGDPQPMELGVAYTITIVGTGGHTLVANTMTAPPTTFAAPDCRVYVDTDPDGSTCDAQYPADAPAGLTSWIRILPDPRVIYTTGSTTLTEAFTQVEPGTYVVHAVAAEGHVLAPEAEKTWTIVVEELGECAPPVSPTLKATAVVVCEANVPWIDYDVELVDPEGRATSDEAHLIFSDGSNTHDIALGDLEGGTIDGRLLWPGASVNSLGVASGWPGWEQDADGAWVTTTGNFNWTRSITSVTFSVNPDVVVALSYPPVTSACADAPPPTTPRGSTVTPAADSVSATCSVAGSYTLGSNSAVLWTVNGQAASAGTVTVRGDVTITAVARPASGYTFSEGYSNPTTYTFDFDRPAAAGCSVTTSDNPKSLPLTGTTTGNATVALGLLLLGLGGLVIATRVLRSRR